MRNLISNIAAFTKEHALAFFMIGVLAFGFGVSMPYMQYKIGKITQSVLTPVKPVKESTTTTLAKEPTLREKAALCKHIDECIKFTKLLEKEEALNKKIIVTEVSAK